MEHFTAAQGAGKSNVGFGLEDANTAVNQAHPAHDFESFVSTHLGFEAEEDFSTQVTSNAQRLSFACFAGAILHDMWSVAKYAHAAPMITRFCLQSHPADQLPICRL